MNPLLLAQIQACLGAALTPSLTAASKGNDLYEAYVWALVVDAARIEGATVQFRDVHGNAITTFHFRTSPGNIWSTQYPYAHAVIAFDRCPILEAHVGIYVAGRSEVPHECDIAVLYQEEAETCRRARDIFPRCGKVILAAECKHYISSTVGLGLGRGFLGLRNELHPKARFFVTTGSTNSVNKMLAKHTDTTSLRQSPLEPNYQERLRRRFEQVFSDFKATHRT